jgi:hypothetical protein
MFIVADECMCGKKLYARGICRACYQFLLDRRKKNRLGVCRCGNKAGKWDWCSKCLNRLTHLEEREKALAKIEKRLDTCMCGNPSRVLRSLCKQCHSYVRMRITKENSARTSRCGACGRPITSKKQFCSKHYMAAKEWFERKKKCEQSNTQ